VHKGFLIAELIVGFVPAIFVWLLGVVLLPLHIGYIVGGSEPDDGTELLVLHTFGVIAGLLGLLAAGTLGFRSLGVNGAKFQPKTTILFSLLGGLPLVYLMLSSSSWSYLIYGLPIIVGTHLGYLNRDYLFPHTRHES
jgi:hypothetical protein